MRQRVTLNDLLKVQAGLKVRPYDHTRYGEIGDCGCVLGELARVKNLLHDNGIFYDGVTAKHLLLTAPPLRKYGSYITRLRNASAKVSKKEALKIVQKFINAFRRDKNHATR